MIARIRPLPHFSVAFILLVALAVVLLLSHPAARTVSTSLGLQLASLHSQNYLEDMEFKIGEEVVDGEKLFRFYSTSDSRPVWSGSDRAEANARAAFTALQNAPEQGLDPTAYHLPQLRRPSHDATSQELATFDLLLTDAILRYARELRTGRTTPSAIYRNIDLPIQTFDAISALRTAIVADTFVEFLEDLAPTQPEYAQARTMLAEYRQLARGGDWPEIPFLPKLVPKQHDPRLAILRDRLLREDTALTDASKDDDVVTALKRYQARNGLEPDGVLGSRTVAMLNLQPRERVAQIEANMERWRWLPHRMDSRYVMVNAADASLQVVDREKIILRSKVIVGEPSKPTPMLRVVATDVTVNPPWNVPASIARNEILPKLKRNPNYLAEQHMVLVNGPSGDPQGKTVDWKRMTPANFHYQIRQLPGADNALGSLKLEMPNTFNVYLHDTPGKRAFDRASRNLSHGCIRVQEILSLASIALTGDSTDAVERLRKEIAVGETKRIPLRERLPVYVMYWTVTSNPDGTLGFRHDVYDRDKPLIAALKPRLTQIAADFPGCTATG